ncbi:MAG: helix-turn-helix domain-containing protein [Micromonosporaceae bacterium]|nr:helix-turn-helix domain-containing protein [Micromonosporaceae bacterium]
MTSRRQLAVRADRDLGRAFPDEVAALDREVGLAVLVEPAEDRLVEGQVAPAGSEPFSRPGAQPADEIDDVALHRIDRDLFHRPVHGVAVADLEQRVRVPHLPLLREAREQLEISSKDVAEKLEWHRSKVTKLEKGTTKISAPELDRLIEIYQVDEAQAERMRTLGREARKRGVMGRVPDWAQTYVELEQAAEEIKLYEAELVPALLQTEDYARSLLATSLITPAEDAEPRAKERVGRQERLTNGNPPRLWAVLGEAALPPSTYSTGGSRSSGSPDGSDARCGPPTSLTRTGAKATAVAVPTTASRSRPGLSGVRAAAAAATATASRWPLMPVAPGWRSATRKTRTAPPSWSPRPNSPPLSTP